MSTSDQVCYINCGFCNTILVVNVPSNNMFNAVAVTCGVCANVLSLNLQTFIGKNISPLQNMQSQNLEAQCVHMDYGSSSKRAKLSVINPMDCVPRPVQLIQYPASTDQKRRVPSAYNRFIKEEILRLKMENPKISHKEAFSAAAKNWSRFPEIHLELSIKGKKQV